MLSSLSHLLRLTRVGFVLTREGVFSLADPAAMTPTQRTIVRLLRMFEKREAGGKALAKAFTRLGPTYVKLGQFLATRPDLVGIKNARKLESLQDRMPSFPRDVALKIIEDSLGKTIPEVFAEIGEPVAAASVAQVHKATTDTADGSLPVAVKVLRPGVRERFAKDIGAMIFAATKAEHLGGQEARRLRPVESVKGFARSVSMETDLRLEAAALSELRENSKADPEFRVPSVDWERTGREVLTTEWIDGIPVSNIEALDAAGHDRKRLASIAMQMFLRHALRDGFFHADMHQGNLFVDAEGRLVAVDCGIMGRLGLRERRFLAEILYGFITRDYRRVSEVHFEAGYVPPHHSVDEFAQAIRAIGEPIHDRPARDISMARLLTLLFEITAIFEMQTRTELVLLQKTMIVVEGVSRSLDPDFDMWSASEPVIREWIEKNLGPIGKLQEMGRDGRAMLSAAARLPELVERGTAVLAALETQALHGLRLLPDTVEAIGRAQSRFSRLRHLVYFGLALTALYLIFWRH